MLDQIFPSVSSIISITALGAAFGAILSYAKTKLHVERDPRLSYITEALPGANCGGCGFPGCSGYAMKILDGSAPINLCMVGGEDAVEKISRIMDIKAEALKPRVARVHCHGGNDVTNNRFEYDGPKNCSAAQQIREGFKTCAYGCLGFGDCMEACPFEAIHMGPTGLPVIDYDLCTGCGNCVVACPRNIISLVDKNFDIHVMCRNIEKTPVMKKGCSVGCTACNRCVRACKEVFADNPDIETAITVINFLADIDYTLCINCGKCAEVCPQKVIEFSKVPVFVG